MYSQAQDDLKQAIKLAPGDKVMRKEWETLKEEKKKYLEGAGAMKNMFSGGIYDDKKTLQRKVFDKLPAFDPENV